MTLSSSVLSYLADSVPAFSVAETRVLEWMNAAEVQSYLNFYQINFSRTLENVKHRLGKIEVAGYRIVLHYWQPVVPVRGTVFVVHGYYDHAGIYGHLVRFLLQNRLAVVICENPGHGLSSGERATIGSFDEYSEVLQACLNLFADTAIRPWFGVGQSTGAAVILNSMKREQPLPFERIVLLAPLVRAYGWRYLQWVYALVKPLRQQLPRTFSANSHDADFVEFLKYRDPLQPRFLSLPWVAAKQQWIQTFTGFSTGDEAFLTIQGDGDTTVDWRFNTALIQNKFPNSRLEIVPRARHQLVNESVDYRKPVFQKLLNYLLHCDLP
ncbi:MAG: alpha/beta hydrolase [Exilibacterium sp.]